MKLNRDLHIADGMRAVIAEEDSDYCPTFLPNGASTVSAVTGVVTGFADANLYLTTMPEAFAAPYPTASAPQLAALGYETNFWYAGPATWERIGAFTRAQGFAFLDSAATSAYLQTKSTHPKCAHHAGISPRRENQR